MTFLSPEKTEPLVLFRQQVDQDVCMCGCIEQAMKASNMKLHSSTNHYSNSLYSCMASVYHLAMLGTHRLTCHTPDATGTVPFSQIKVGK